MAEGLERGREFGAWQRGLSRDHLGIVKYLSGGQLCSVDLETSNCLQGPGSYGWRVVIRKSNYSGDCRSPVDYYTEGDMYLALPHLCGFLCEEFPEF